MGNLTFHVSCSGVNNCFPCGLSFYGFRSGNFFQNGVLEICSYFLFVLMFCFCWFNCVLFFLLNHILHLMLYKYDNFLV